MQSRRAGVSQNRASRAAAPPLRPAPNPATPDVRRGSRRAGGGVCAAPPSAAAAGGLRAGLPIRIPLTLFSAFVLIHTSRWSRS